MMMVSMPLSPTERSLALLRRTGWLAAVVECSCTKYKRDLYGVTVG